MERGEEKYAHLGLRAFAAIPRANVFMSLWLFLVGWIGLDFCSCWILDWSRAQPLTAGTFLFIDIYFRPGVRSWSTKTFVYTLFMVVLEISMIVCEIIFWSCRDILRPTVIIFIINISSLSSMFGSCSLMQVWYQRVNTIELIFRYLGCRTW